MAPCRRKKLIMALCRISYLAPFLVPKKHLLALCRISDIAPFLVPKKYLLALSRSFATKTQFSWVLLLLVAISLRVTLLGVVIGYIRNP